MKEMNKLPSLDLWTVLMSAYLINQFYFRNAVSLQRVALWGILFLYVVLNFNVPLRIMSATKKTCALQFVAFGAVLWFALVGLIPIISGSGDFSYVAYCMTFISWTMYLLAIVIRLKKRYPQQNTMEMFMKTFLWAMALYVLVTTIILAFPGLRQVITEIISISETDLAHLSRDKYYTRIGWAGFSGYTTSMKCTVALCFALYFLVKRVVEKWKVEFAMIVMYALTLLGNFYYARTGLLISALCTGGAILYLALRLKRIKLFLKIVALSLAAIAAGVVALNNMSGENVVINWIFELFINANQGKGLSAISLTLLGDMYFIPPMKTFFFGDGWYTAAEGGYYMKTDAGCMRLMLYFGVFGVLFIYSIFFGILSKIRKIGKTPHVQLLTTLLFFVFLGFELKGESIVILIPLSVMLLWIIERPNVKG